MNNEDSKKYIVFSKAQREHEIDEVFRILNTVFIEASRLGRIPAIGNFAVLPSQNLGIKRKDFCFSDYLDLSKGTIRKRDRVDRVIEDHQEWIAEENLDLEAYPADKTCQIKNDIISPEMNEQHDVIIRRNPTYQYVKNYFKQEEPDIFLDFPCSEKVNQLTDIVLNALGTTHKDAWVALCNFLDKVGTMRSCFDEATRKRGSSISLTRGHYACLRVLSNQGVHEQSPPVQLFSSTKKQIQEVLSYAISKKSRIYIISDIQDPQYFDFLKESYEVYRYHDFPELKQLVSGENGHSIDNVMLYMVERNIMKYATVKILPPRQGSIMCHLNEVYNLSILKNPPMRMAQSEVKN